MGPAKFFDCWIDWKKWAFAIGYMFDYRRFHFSVGPLTAAIDFNLLIPRPCRSPDHDPEFYVACPDCGEQFEQ